jgi:aspartate racemase
MVAVQPRDALVGVLGGMGPLATADFLQKLARSTPVGGDADHVRTVTWSDPSTPDRTRALLGLGCSPVPAMQAGVERLVEAGAEILVIPCNTAHAFLPELSIPSGVQLISMVDATWRHVCGGPLCAPTAGRVGLLATRGTRRASLYDVAFAEVGVDVVHVSAEVQTRAVDRAIAEVKSGGALDVAADLVAVAGADLIDRRAEVILAACTEISTVLADVTWSTPSVDTAQCLVDDLLRALGRSPQTSAAPTTHNATPHSATAPQVVERSRDLH